MNAFKKKMVILNLAAKFDENHKSPIKDALCQFKTTRQLFQAIFTKLDIAFLETAWEFNHRVTWRTDYSAMFQTVLKMLTCNAECFSN